MSYKRRVACRVNVYSEIFVARLSFSPYKFTSSSLKLRQVWKVFFMTFLITTMWFNNIFMVHLRKISLLHLKQAVDVDWSAAYFLTDCDIDRYKHYLEQEKHLS